MIIMTYLLITRCFDDLYISNFCTYSVGTDKFAFLISIYISELAVPAFEHDGQTFSKCLLLQRLLVTGYGEEEVLRTKQKLPSILSHTCRYRKDFKTTEKVSIPLFSFFTISPQVTSLHLAAGFSSASIVKVILEAGIDINVRDDNGRTPLHYALRHNNADIVSLLIDSGADVEADSDSSTKLRA